ncbi:MAG TPA: hypothetical protein VLQ90_08895 [Pyrinomonadaceae bacterium]|nr:hypothetical protein [Pyrinomonadaceae bacterium]
MQQAHHVRTTIRASIHGAFPATRSHLWRPDGSIEHPEGGPGLPMVPGDLEDVSGIPDYSGCGEVMTGVDGRSLRQGSQQRRLVPPMTRTKWILDFWGSGAGHDVHWARNEGVGEHVRIRFHADKTVGEIADLKIRTVRRKTVSSAGSVFDGASPSKLRSGRLT